MVLPPFSLFLHLMRLSNPAHEEMCVVILSLTCCQGTNDCGLEHPALSCTESTAQHKGYVRLHARFCQW